MKDNKGIALIASLLIMAAVMALGLGSIFLAQMNLKIAENTRSNAVARYHAEAGLDTAVALLKKIHTDTGKFPATFTLPVTSGQSYAMLAGVEGYRRDNVNQVRVKVEGFTPNNARYVAEALVAPVLNPAFLKGLTSEGNIRVTGLGNAEFVNAGIHGNTGVNLPGGSSSNFRTCTTPTQSFNSCAIASPLPVSSSNGMDCYLVECNPWAPEQKIDPKYIVKRNDAIAINTFGLTYYLDASDNRVSDGRGGYLYADPAAPSTSININWEDNANVYSGRCTVVYNSSDAPLGTTTITVPSVAPRAKICAKDGLSLNFASGIDMTDVTVIADGNITFGGVSSCTGTCTAGTLENTKLISRTRIPPTATVGDPNDARGGVMLDIVTGKNLTIFSGANRDVASSSPYYLIGVGFNLIGNTTIASNRDIQFAGKTLLTEYPDKPGAVTTAIISTRRITNSGSSDFYGVFWAGTCFAQSGSTKIYGTVAVREPKCTTGGNPSAIDINGKLHINSSYAVDNWSLYGAMAVASRR